jgi:Tfp pilus assembly protein PilV
MKQAGFSVVEALVGAALAGIAVALLAGVAGLTSRSVCLARDSGFALALAVERAEALRAGPRADGADTRAAADGTVYSRSWQVAGGRGVPVRLSVQVTWGNRVRTLATEVLP